MKREPWTGGKVRTIRDRRTGKRIEFAIEDKDGILWSGKAIARELDKQMKKKPISDEALAKKLCGAYFGKKVDWVSGDWLAVARRAKRLLSVDKPKRL